MKFTIKYTDGVTEWWEENDRAEIRTQRDAFLFGKVLAEYWNTDLRPGENERKVLNARILGKGKDKGRLIPSGPTLPLKHTPRTVQ